MVLTRRRKSLHSGRYHLDQNQIPWTLDFHERWRRLSGKIMRLNSAGLFSWGLRESQGLCQQSVSELFEFIVCFIWKYHKNETRRVIGDPHLCQREYSKMMTLAAYYWGRKKSAEQKQRASFSSNIFVHDFQVLSEKSNTPLKWNDFTHCKNSGGDHLPDIILHK